MSRSVVTLLTFFALTAAPVLAQTHTPGPCVLRPVRS